jgi:parallel beta helix pectate lyase-like protein/concanavalin A-like lectin/glucanase superfamily protein
MYHFILQGKAKTLVLIIIFILPLILPAKNIYLSMAGKDTNSGTKNNPVLSYQKAEVLWSPGDEIVILGHYLFPIIIKQTGKEGSPFIIRGENGSVIDGSKGHIYGIFALGNKTLKEEGILIKDIKIINTKHAAIYIRNIDNVVIENVTVQANGYFGIYARNINNLIIKNTLIDKTWQRGFNLLEIKNGAISQNIIHNAGIYGIYADQCRNLLFKNNFCFFNTKCGLRLNGSRGCIVKNNTFIYNGFNGMDLNSGCVSNLITRNIMYENGYQELNIKGSGASSRDNLITHNSFFARNSAIRCNNKARNNKFQNNIILKTALNGELISLADRHDYSGEVFDFDLIYAPPNATISSNGKHIYKTFKEFQESGHEKNGVWGKPIFRDKKKFDFKLTKESPGYSIIEDEVKGPEMEWYGPKIYDISMKAIDSSSGKTTMRFIADSDMFTTWKATAPDNQWVLFKIDPDYIGKTARYFRVITESLFKLKNAYIAEIELQVADTIKGPFYTVYKGNIKPPDLFESPLYFHYQLYRCFEMHDTVKLKAFLKLKVKSVYKDYYSPQRDSKLPALSEFDIFHIEGKMELKIKEENIQKEKIFKISPSLCFDFNKTLKPSIGEVGRIAFGDYSFIDGKNKQGIYIPRMPYNYLRFEGIDVTLKEGGVSFYVKSNSNKPDYIDSSLFSITGIRNIQNPKENRGGNKCIRLLYLPSQTLTLFYGKNRLDKKIKLKNDKWHLIKVMWSQIENRILLSVDGEEVSATIMETPKEFPQYIFYLGCAPGGKSQFLGYFDELKIFCNINKKIHDKEKK